MNQTDQPLTKKDLEISLAAFGTQLANAIITQLRGEIRASEERVTENLRDEFTSKLTAASNSLESNLKRHAEEVAAEHSSEVLQAIANVVEPLQTTVTDHDHRLTRLEHKIA